MLKRLICSSLDRPQIVFKNGLIVSEVCCFIVVTSLDDLRLKSNQTQVAHEVSRRHLTKTQKLAGFS